MGLQIGKVIVLHPVQAKVQSPEHQTLARGLACGQMQCDRLIHRICVEAVIGYRNALYSV